LEYMEDEAYKKWKWKRGNRIVLANHAK